MKVLLMISLMCLPLSVLADDLDNWYFKFLSVERKVTGETFSAEGENVGTFTGTTSGEVSEDGKTFTERFEYLYMPEEHHVKDTLVWTKDEKGIFRSSSEDSLGNKFFCELSIKADDQYHLKTIFEDGRTCETTAELKEDGVLHAIDTAKDKEGNVVFMLKYKRSLK